MDESNPCAAWQPRSHREPEVFVRVLKALLGPSDVTLTRRPFFIADDNETKVSTCLAGKHVGVDIEFEDVVAEAFCKMNNLVLEAMSEE